jgi:glyoxylase-like metal-dependent hydrolase (beta-lactamase superfamily II)
MRAPRTLLVALSLIALALAAVAGQQAPPQPNFAAISVRSLKVQANVYMLAGAGGNVTVQVGDDGVLVVDTQYEAMADKLLAEIRTLAGSKPIRYVINTHAHPDHTGGNARLMAAGQTVVAGNVVFDVRGGTGATVIAHENVQVRMAQPGPDGQVAPFAAMPTETFFTNKMGLFFNDEAIELLHQPAAHTDGDVIVFFRKSDVIAAGDVFGTTSFPVIDIARGGHINGIVAALNRIIDITQPRDKQEGGTMVIPGHGRICDEADVVEYRDMVTIIRDRIQAWVKKGMTLEQVKAAKPTLDYDGRYGATSGFWTTDMFVEAVYRNLAPAPRTAEAR